MTSLFPDALRGSGSRVGEPHVLAQQQVLFPPALQRRRRCPSVCIFVLHFVRLIDEEDPLTRREVNAIDAVPDDRWEIGLVAARWVPPKRFRDLEFLAHRCPYGTGRTMRVDGG